MEDENCLLVTNKKNFSAKKPLAKRVIHRLGGKAKMVAEYVPDKNLDLELAYQRVQAGGKTSDRFVTALYSAERVAFHFCKETELLLRLVNFALKKNKKVAVYGCNHTDRFTEQLESAGVEIISDCCGATRFFEVADNVKTVAAYA